MYDTLLKIGPVTLRFFNLFLAAGFLFGAYYLIRYAARKKQNVSFLRHAFFPILIGALLIGRLFHVLENLPFFREHLWRVLAVFDLQFSFFGVVYGTLFMLLILCRKHRENFWVWLDGMTLAGLITLIFLYIGHFFNGTEYGTPTDLPWGIAFDTINIPFTTPIHPVQLYAALTLFLIFGIISHYGRRHHHPGIVGTLGLILSGLTVLGLNFLSGTPSLYDKVNAGLLTTLAFLAFVYVSHQPSTIGK